MCRRETKSVSLLEFGFLSCKTQLLFLLPILNILYCLLGIASKTLGWVWHLIISFIIPTWNRAVSSSRIHWKKCLCLHLHISSAWCVINAQEEVGLKEGKKGGIEEESRKRSGEGGERDRTLLFQSIHFLHFEGLSHTFSPQTPKKPPTFLF